MKAVLKTHKKILIVAGTILILLVTLGLMTLSMAAWEMDYIHSSMASTMSTFENEYEREKGIVEAAEIVYGEITQGNTYLIESTFREAKDVQKALDLLKTENMDCYLIDASGKTHASKGSPDHGLSQTQMDQLIKEGRLSVETDEGDVCYTGIVLPQGLFITCYGQKMKLSMNSALTGISARYSYFIASESDGIISMSDNDALIGSGILSNMDTSLFGTDKNLKSKNDDYQYGFTDLSIGKTYCLMYKTDGFIIGLYYRYKDILADILNEMITPIVVLMGTFVVILVFFFILWNSTEEKEKRWVRVFKTNIWIEKSMTRHLSCFILFTIIVCLLFNYHFFEFSSYSLQNVLATENLDMLAKNIEACEEDKNTIIGIIEDYMHGVAEDISDLLVLNHDLCSHEELQKMTEECHISKASVYNKDGVLEASSEDYYGYELTHDENDPMFGARKVLTGDREYVFVDYNDKSGRFFIAQKRKDVPGVICLEYQNPNLSRMLKYYSTDEAIRNTDFGNATTFFVKTNEDVTYIIEPYTTEVVPTQIEMPKELEQDKYSGIIEIDGVSAYASSKKSSGITVISAVACKQLKTAITTNIFVLLGSFAALALLLAYGCLCHPEPIETKQEEDTPSEQEIITSRKQESPFADACFREMLKYEFVVLIIGYCIMMFKTTGGGQTLIEFIFRGKWDKGINLFSINASIIVAVVTVIILYVIKKLLIFIGKSIGNKGITISSIAVSLIEFLGLFFIILHTLYQFGVDTTALVASAGIAGLVIGIAAKDIVSDLVAGLFLIFEGNIRVGDFVKFKDFRGEVTEIGARVTVIKRYNNKLIVNNSDLKQYYRLSDEYGSAWVEIEVAPDEDIDRIRQLISDSGEWYRSRIPALKDGPWFLNISHFDSSGITICLCGICADERSGPTKRRIILNTLELFRENGIRLGKNVMKIEVEKDNYYDQTDLRI